MTSAWAADLAFAIDIGVRAGAVLMDRYERLERIHHKSAKDVVTEADTLSEKLILAAIREHSTLEQVTTPSLEALKAYSSARSAVFARGFAAAIPAPCRW